MSEDKPRSVRASCPHPHERRPNRTPREVLGEARRAMDDAPDPEGAGPPLPVKERIHRELPLALVAVGAAAALAVATPHGLGVSTDSVAYLSAASSLLHRGTLLVTDEAGGLIHFTRFPPAYPAALAASAVLAGDPVRGARVLGVLLFAVNVFLMGWIATRISGSSRLGVATTRSSGGWRPRARGCCSSIRRRSWRTGATSTTRATAPFSAPRSSSSICSRACFQV